MKAIIFYSVLILIAVFFIGKFDPLNINYHYSNAKSIQYELIEALNGNGSKNK